MPAKAKAKAKPKEHKLDIFETLAAIDRKDYGYLQGKPEDIRKAFAPVVVLRWAGATTDGPYADANILLVNEIANINFFDLYGHPELQYRLLAASGLGVRQRHQFITFPKQVRGSEKIASFVARFYPFANSQEIELLLSQFTRETFVEFVNRSGCTPTEAKEVIDAFEKKEGKP